MSILNNSFHTKQNPVFTGLKFGFGSTSGTEVIPIPYWIATIGGTSNDYGYDVALDNSGNVYVCGQTPGDINDAFVAKYNNSGVLQWQKQLNSSGVNDYAYGITADNDSVYIVGTTFRSGKSKLYVQKFSSAGVAQWGKFYDYDTTQGSGIQDFVRSEGEAIVNDSSYLYVTGRLDTDSGANNRNIVVIRINKSSGNSSWFNTLGSTSGSSRATGRAIEVKNGALYISGDYTTGDDGYVAKLNSANGSLTWQRSIISQTSSAETYGIAVDSSDNVYICGKNDDFLFVIQYDSSGTLGWRRKIYDTSVTYLPGHGIVVDSSDNIYIVGRAVISGYSSIFIAKLNNSNGTIQWQRTLGATSNHDYGQGITLDSSNNIYIAGYTRSVSGNNNDILIARLPNDGTLEDTYGNLIYQQSSFSEDSNSGMSYDSSPNNFGEDPQTISGDSLTVSDTSFTITNSSLTSDTTELD